MMLVNLKFLKFVLRAVLISVLHKYILLSNYTFKTQNVKSSWRHFSLRNHHSLLPTMEEDNLSDLLDVCFELLWLVVHECFIVHTFHQPLNSGLNFLCGSC